MSQRFKIFFLLSFLPFWMVYAFSNPQEPYINQSLLGIVGNNKSDSAKVSALINVCREKCKIAQYTDARKFADAALSIAQKNNYTYGIADTYNMIGIIYWYIKDYDNALSFHLKALTLFENIASKKGIAATYTRIGHAYADIPDNKKALDYFTKALKLEQDLNNPLHISKNLNLIGFIYMRKAEYALALKYYFETYELVKKLDYKRGLAAIHHDIGEVYEKQNKTAEALDEAKKGLKYALQVGESKMIEEAYSGLEKIYLSKKDYKSAYDARLKYDEILLWLSNADHAGKIRQMEMDYEYEKKLTEEKIKIENEKEIASIKLASQTRLIYFAFAGTLATILFSVFIYRSYKKQQEANRLLKETQQQLIESEKMAAIGGVASRLAHEILNPLNFINNFSGTSSELMDELKLTLDDSEAMGNAAIITDNLKKIKEHGEKATAIVRQLESHAHKGTAHKFFEAGDANADN